MRTKLLSLTLLMLTGSGALAQEQNPNLAAIDTLTKGVALAVFQAINQPKAQEIYTQLLDCGDGCDAQQIIRAVGSWDQVGQRLQFFNQLRDTKTFQILKPGDANVAIRQQLIRFYQQNKAYESYRKALTPTVQLQLVSRLDAMLPPNPETSTDQAAAPATTSALDKSATQTDNESDIDPAAIQAGKSERNQTDDEGNKTKLMIFSALLGLLVGGGAVYLLLYRRTKEDLDYFKSELSQLQKSKGDQRVPPDANPTQAENRYKANAFDAIARELDTDDPLSAVRWLNKQQSQAKMPKPVAPLTPRSGEPAIESEPPAEAVPLPPMTPLEPLVPMTTARSEVFYFPPPDPTGQFDMGQKSGSLTPESAYRFSVEADNPAVAMFRFEADPGRLSRFLTYRNYMIEPACDSENSYSSAFTRVTTVKDGEAILENGNWRVKTKAMIRYE